ncbi:MAG: hypothetical protein ACYC3W_09885 [Candidatus Nanopelagicales bacterium]
MNREELLSALALKKETAAFQGGEVTVTELGAADIMKLWDDYPTTNGTSTFTAALIAACVLDDEGQKVFSEADIPLLENSAQTAFFELAKAARAVNGIGGAEEKNSDPSPADSLPTASV